MINTYEKIGFEPITLEKKEIYDRALSADSGERGCEFSFANLYLWGRQYMATIGETVMLFSQFDRRSVYPYPVGSGDKRAALDSIISDARSRGIPCRITGLSESDRETVEALYPEMFRYHNDEGSYDYVYDINDLADLKGKKYDGKRNHINRFAAEHPDFTVEPISDENLDKTRAMVAEWYRSRLEENPDADFHMERAAIERALRDREALGMDGIVLLCDGEVIAMTLGNRMREDTYDVNFEKARADIQGAYPTVNREFARYLREKYPTLRYIDREEDMGSEGLRRAKKSYHPHHMIKKYWACLLEDGYDY